MTALSQKIADAFEILSAVGIPIATMTVRRQRRLSLALLAVANLPPAKEWSEAACWGDGQDFHITTRQIITFWNKHYGEAVSSGSYDDVRRKDLIYLTTSGIAIKSAADPDANTNNPTRGYAISSEASELLRSFGTPTWLLKVMQFRNCAGALSEKLERRREQTKVPVLLPNGKRLELSPGPHNELQKAIVEDFLPRFVPDANVLYLGDTAKKTIVLESAKLNELGFFELAHDALPDVVALDPRNKWIFLIEAVHSSNPISKLRHLLLEEMTAKCSLPRVYVSVFQNRQSLREWILDISWETEVWLTENPDHMIHFNGGKFLGPHAPHEGTPSTD